MATWRFVIFSLSLSLFPSSVLSGSDKLRNPVVRCCCRVCLSRYTRTSLLLVLSSCRSKTKEKKLRERERKRRITDSKRVRTSWRVNNEKSERERERGRSSRPFKQSILERDLTFFSSVRPFLFSSLLIISQEMGRKVSLDCHLA